MDPYRSTSAIPHYNCTTVSTDLHLVHIHTNIDHSHYATTHRPPVLRGYTQDDLCALTSAL
jgi:hypothetical protein